MNKLSKAKDFIELANVIIKDDNITTLVPKTMENVRKITNCTSLKDKIFCEYFLFSVVDELSHEYNEHYGLNILFDIDLLKFIIYYYVKATTNITDKESDLMVLLNNYKDKINQFDFSCDFNDQPNDAITIQAQINLFVSKL